MPEISLKDYFAKLNSLLSSSAADEVVHHSRHILKYYPKNVTAARFLGRALVLLGRWDEGRDSLRRVLSVVPDDYAAHLALSEANERMNRADEAIWHLERAFEQRPNDKELIDALRGLYRRYRQIDNLKIQLTSATVARQYLRSGAYTQAIDALRGALARMNDRLDLKLLLAQTLWQQGSKEEAAEIALEVLKILPDCLEANRIMAQLWLDSGRPSDAQRYVNHLEGVDPYLAVELVQGEPPDDDVFRLDELDYARSSQSEMTSARPDWLHEISTVPAAAEEAQQPASELSDWASAMLGAQKQPQAAKPPAEQGTTSSRFAAMAQGDEPQQGGLTDIFGKPEEANTAELSALFDSQTADADDPMAWLRETGVEIVDEDDEPAFQNLFDDEDAPLPDADQDPMAWLKDANGDAILEGENDAADDPFAWVSSEARPVGQPQNAGSDTGDSLDWLHEDALLDEALDLDDISEGQSPELATHKMQLPGKETAQTGAPEGGTNVPGPRRGLTAMLQETNFDWTNKQDSGAVSDDEMDEWLNQFGVNEPRKAETETPAWLNDLEQPEMSRLEADEWFKPEETPSVPELPHVSPDELIRLSSDDDEDSDWLADLTPQEEPTPDDEFAWQTPTELPAETPAETPVEAEPVVEIPDWLSSLEPEEPEEPEEPDEPEDEAEEPAAEDEFAWMTDDVLTNAEGSADDALDWFAELEPQATPETEPEAPVSADSGLAWTGDEVEASAELLSTGVPDWLSDLQNLPPASDIISDETKVDAEFSWVASEPAEPAAEAETPAASKPDWLADFTGEGAAGAPEPLVSDADFSWMTEDALAESEPEAEAPAGGLPDWLSELQPPAAASEPAVEAISDTDFTWLSEDEVPTEAEAEVEPAEAIEAPDWLSELEPAATEPAAEPVIDAEFAWLSEEEAPTEADAEVEPAEAIEAPDWLSELEPAAEAEPAAEPVIDAEFAWLSEEEAPTEAEAEVEPAEAIEAPDWLSELEPAAEAEPAAEPVVDAEFSWMTEEEAPTEAEVEPAEAIEAPDWLSELEPAAATELTAAPVVDAEFTWMTEEAASEEAEPAAEAAPVSAEPDWLSELDLTGTPGAPEAELAEADITWTSDELQPPAAELEPAAPEDMDWLNELAPQTEAEEQDFEAEESPADEFAWLDEVESDAEQLVEEPAEAAEAEPVMAATVPESADAFEEDELMPEEEDEMLEPTPAQNAPDWLNAMVPGLDVDYEAGGEPLEEEIEEPVAESSTGEFAWVVEMVEQEIAVTDRPRFVFSRPPVWLQPTNGASHGDMVDDDLPDWPSDDADADVPEWLR